MPIFTMWALSYLVDGEALLAGKYVTLDQAEQAKKAIEANGVTAWITEETWDFGPEGAVRIDEHSPDRSTRPGGASSLRWRTPSAG